MQLDGFWYAHNQSKRLPASINKTDTGDYFLNIEEQTLQINTSKIQISTRLGSSNRRINFTDGAVFETMDNDTVDAMFVHLISKKSNILHRLESRWRWVGISVILIIVLGFVTVRFGFPWASKQIAYALPSYINEQLSTSTLELLDEYLFEKSDLSPQQQNAIQANFNQLTANLEDGEFNYQLHIRKMGEESNAFSLPSGDIILTDALLLTANNAEQINSILLHEIGHVEHRHGLQQVVYSSLISTAISMMTSDLTVLEDLLVVMPVFLVESSYSRAHEYEADDFVFEKMLELNQDPIHFANILDMITSNDDIDDDLEKSIQYFSSHPETVKRIENARKKSAEYHLMK